MPDRPSTRFVYHATWVVEVPNLPQGEQATVRQLMPIGPGQMGRVIQLTAQRLLADALAEGIIVGYPSVTLERDRKPVRWEAQEQ